MNQILIMGNKGGKKGNSTVDIKKIVIFFSIAIIIFGIFLIIDGVVGLSKNNNNENQGAVESSPSPEPTPTPVNDDEAPKIDLNISGENIKITATDNVQIDYIEYRWNEDEVQRVDAQEDNQTEISATVNIKQGINTLYVTAVDKSGNIQEKTQDFQGKMRPIVNLFISENGDEVIITAECEDGLSKVEFTQNGGSYNQLPLTDYTKEQWATIGVEIEYSDDGKIISMKYNQKLTEGQNSFYVYAYSIEGLVGEGNGMHEYNP